MFFIIFLVIFQESLLAEDRKLRIPPISKFLIENNGCFIPHIDPSSFQTDYENKSTELNYCPKQQQQLVYFEKTDVKINVFIRNISLENSTEFECCLSNITRNLTISIPDNSFSESKCEFFDNSSEVKYDVIRTVCYNKDTKKKVYEDVHGFFLNRNMTLEDDEISSPMSGFNVLIILVDNISQNNFLRRLKKIHDFLINNNFINLNVFNQVGKDSFQNIIPLLTGFSHRISRMKFGNPSKKFFDGYPFIWKDFYENGYITAFGQDYSEKYFFNEKYMGFFKEPTAYYFRSYAMSLKQLIAAYLDQPRCSGSILAAERILNLILDFVKTFHKRNYFGIFALGTFSELDFNALEGMDEELLKFFETLIHFLDDTIVFFLSTNGYYNDITKKIYGWFESRIPFAYIYVPANFQNNYPEKYKMLLINKNKLISPYDIYVTLQDILKESREGYISKSARSCRNCNSLFRNILYSRSCNDAGIDRYWCTCLNKNFEQLQNGNETNTYYVDI